MGPMWWSRGTSGGVCDVLYTEGKHPFRGERIARSTHGSGCVFPQPGGLPGVRVTSGRRWNMPMVLPGTRSAEVTPPVRGRAGDRRGTEGRSCESRRWDYDAISQGQSRSHPPEMVRVAERRCGCHDWWRRSPRQVVIRPTETIRARAVWIGRASDQGERQYRDFSDRSTWRGTGQVDAASVRRGYGHDLPRRDISCAGDRSCRSARASGTVPSTSRGGGGQRIGGLIHLTVTRSSRWSRFSAEGWIHHVHLGHRAAWTLRNQGRVTDIVSARRLSDHLDAAPRPENPLYEHYDRLLTIAKKYDVTSAWGWAEPVSRGCDGPGSDSWADDPGPAHEMGWTERTGHDEGPAMCLESDPGNILLQNSLLPCAFYVLVPGDRCRRRIRPCGLCIAEPWRWGGADFLCYVTPRASLSAGGRTWGRGDRHADRGPCCGYRQGHKGHWNGIGRCPWPERTWTIQNKLYKDN